VIDSPVGALSKERAVRDYLRSTLVRIGLILLIVGSGPMMFIYVAAGLGLWPDPNPNPIGPALLAFFTFWPSILCILAGVVRAWWRQRSAHRTPGPPPPS